MEAALRTSGLQAQYQELRSIQFTGLRKARTDENEDREAENSEKAIGGGLSVILTSALLLTCVKPRLEEKHGQAIQRSCSPAL